MACLLGIDPEKSYDRCYPGECRIKQCGWDTEEAARRSKILKERGLTLYPDGLYRLCLGREPEL